MADSWSIVYVPSHDRRDWRMIDDDDGKDDDGDRDDDGGVDEI